MYKIKIQVVAKAVYKDESITLLKPSNYIYFLIIKVFVALVNLSSKIPIQAFIMKPKT